MTPLPPFQSQAVASTDDPVWTKGDFKLISSDHICFHIPSYFLQCWSDVFRGMLELCGGERLIHVTETSATIRHFLHLITKLQIDAAAIEVALFDNVMSLVAFLEKYHCPLALDLLIERTDNLVYEGRWPHFLLFLIGAHVDRPCLCKDVIACGKDNVWKSYDSAKRPQGVATELKTLNFRSLPHSILTQLPIEYAWALVCADVSSEPADTRFSDLKKDARFVAFLEECTGKTYSERPT